MRDLLYAMIKLKLNSIQTDYDSKPTVRMVIEAAAMILIIVVFEVVVAEINSCVLCLSSMR